METRKVVKYIAAFGTTIIACVICHGLLNLLIEFAEDALCYGECVVAADGLLNLLIRAMRLVDICIYPMGILGFLIDVIEDLENKSK